MPFELSEKVKAQMVGAGPQQRAGCAPQVHAHKARNACCAPRCRRRPAWPRPRNCARATAPTPPCPRPGRPEPQRQRRRQRQRGQKRERRRLLVRRAPRRGRRGELECVRQGGDWELQEEPRGQEADRCAEGALRGRACRRWAGCGPRACAVPARARCAVLAHVPVPCGAPARDCLRPPPSPLRLCPMQCRSLPPPPPVPPPAESPPHIPTTPHPYPRAPPRPLPAHTTPNPP